MANPRNSTPITSRGQAADEASYNPAEVAIAENDARPPQMHRAEGSLHHPENERPDQRGEFGRDGKIVTTGEPDSGPLGGNTPADRHGNKS